jgi:hypothetical protein
MPQKCRRRPAKGGAAASCSHHDSPANVTRSAKQAHSAALKARDTARSISATDLSLQTQEIGYELERLADAVADLAAIVARMVRAAR